jgi:glycerophosphoryl diester phosphodiesterase
MAPPLFLAQNSRPLVLGHRGSSAAYPENTLLAFEQAMAEGADGIELDAMCCASGEVVVVHDDDLGRVSGQPRGSGLLVRKSSLTELRRVDVGQGERIPTLRSVLERLGGQALINIELKSAEVHSGREHLELMRDDGLAAATVELLAELGRPPGTTLISSFDPFQLWRFAAAAKRRRLDGVPLGFLFAHDQQRPLREAWIAPLLPIAAVHPEGRLVDALALRRYRRRGYAVHVWTIDDPHEVAALTALGVDAIITNRPRQVRDLVQSAVAAQAPTVSTSGGRLEPPH